ncbi:hypothetical protein BGZ63DRAFT_357001 [Mariannaea sp. PMI_226]|nr:hypothetical protein BGZ63DRAFT_357001 [Mariannaea sp. PMI_226]
MSQQQCFPQQPHLYGSGQILGHGKVAHAPFLTVTEAFYHYATSCPDNLAVHDLSGPTQKITYRELACRVQLLAEELRARGVTPGHRVPLIVKRSLEMIVGIWAILSCGAQYVPLDGGVVPDETIRRVLKEAQGKVVLCLSSTQHRLESLQTNHETILVNGPRSQNLDEIPGDGYVDLSKPDGGCYVIYTSGTTGQPKGVDVTHKNVVNLVCLSPGNLGITPGTTVGSLLNISFDMAAWEIFSCLCNGGTLVLRGAQWEEALDEIEVLICTPTILSKYHPKDYPEIKTVATAGEPITQRLADLWANHGTYWNCCGPTETTIVNTMQRHVVGDQLSIGKPTPNNKVYILDDDGQPTGVGIPGVMWAGGLGVSRGYIGMPEKTAEKYLVDPFANDGSKMYNTGDIGRWRTDGSIEILGRCDDQVKIKGFRVELDGISASLASAPGVSRAAALLINGHIHGFICPLVRDTAAITQYVQKCQPYYAVPSQIYAMDELPTTANGKVDKKKLKASFAEMVKMNSFQITLSKSDLKPQSSTSSLSTLAEKIHQDLSQELPKKQHAQPFRRLRYRIFIVYRTLFSSVTIINFAAMTCVIFLNLNSRWFGTITAINLTTAALVRQDLVINALYTTACSVPKQLPLWLRARCAKIYHLGGIHSAAGVCATAWLVVSTAREVICDRLYCAGHQPNSVVIRVVSWLLCGLLCIMVGSAWPSLRKQHHNFFERFHRFAGWTSLALFWARTILTINGTHASGLGLGHAAISNPDFWLLVVATCSIASSWLFLRKVAVDAEVLSNHAVRLHFDYTVPVNGSFTRVSRRPLLEWHSFATIPTLEVINRPKGYSLVVSNAGDWTRSCIKDPPSKLWVRGLPTCGVMRIATLFNRIVIIATGSGIGPLLGHISQPTCSTQLIWSAAAPELTFGKEILRTVREKIPDAVIHDTKIHGRPDLVRMGFNMAQNFGAEAVIVIANESVTKKIVYGLETRGILAFGAIWDISRVSRQGTLGQIAVAKFYSQSVRPLAYDLHEPAQPQTDKQNSPILFLHGLFGSKKNNRAMSKALARDLGRYVYALDLRNHGESPHNPRHDYVAMAEDVAVFIHDHGLTDTTLIGHSMGAKAAMALALRSPHLVSDLVAVDNAPVDAVLSNDFGGYIRGMKQIDQANVTRQKEADVILSEYEKSLAIRQFLLGNLHRPEGENTQKFRVPLDILARSLGNLGDFPYKDPNEVRFEKPALFVRGTKSKYVPDELIPLIGQFFPRFRLVDVDAGHWLISEQPDTFRRGMRFLFLPNPINSLLLMCIPNSCTAVVEFLRNSE